MQQFTPNDSVLKIQTEKNLEMSDGTIRAMLDGTVFRTSLRTPILIGCIKPVVKT